MSHIHFRKGEVDGSSEPGRSESDADDLDQKPLEVEGIVMKQDPSTISDQFRSDTCEDDRRKEPGSVLEPYREVDKEGNDIECNEDRVGCDCGSIMVDAVLGVAVVGSWRQCAICEFAKGDEVPELGVGRWHVHCGMLLLRCSVRDARKGDLDTWIEQKRGRKEKAEGPEVYIVCIFE